MAAVMAIASAPQNATRAAPVPAGAPPARAAIAPSAARQISDTIETIRGSGLRANDAEQAFVRQARIDFPRNRGRGRAPGNIATVEARVTDNGIDAADHRVDA